MSKRRGPNKENFEETRQAFLEIALNEFTEYGFANASTNRIVEQSGMARGSLYYHFGDKTGLFIAVYRDLLEKASAALAGRMKQEKSPRDALMAGSQVVMDLCMDRAFRKIILLESQAAIPFRDRLQIQEQTLLGTLCQPLPQLLEKGHFPGHTLKTIKTFVMGMLAEIGRAMDFSENLQKDRQMFEQAYNETMNRIFS